MSFERRPASVLLLPLLVIMPLWSCGGGDARAGGGSISEETDAPARLLVVNKSSNTLSIVDPETRSEVAAVEVGYAPHEVAVSRDGRFAYVTDYGVGSRPGNTVSVVDLSRRERVRAIDLWQNPRPHGIDVAPDGTLWVTTEGSRRVLQVDPESGRILKGVQTDQRTTHMVVVAPELDRLATANIGSGTVTIVDTEEGRVVAHVPTGAGAEGIDLHPDGRHVLVTNRDAGTLTEVDLRRGRVTRSLDVGGVPIRVRAWDAGRRALVSNAGGNEIADIDLEAWRVERRLEVGAVPVGILVTPDERWAYVASTRDDRVTVVDLADWSVAGAVVAGDEPDGMAWVR